MNGWVEAKLGDLFSFKNGMNAEKSAYGNGIPFVNVMDVFGTDVLTSDIIRGKIQASENQIKEYLVKRGDVLFNRTSETFDEIALATVYMDDAPIVFGGFVIRARPRTSKLDPNFCVYFFQADAMRREMIRRGQGAVRANIGQKDLATVPAAVPPLAEQKRIAEILSTWDRAIETTEKLIANSEAQKKALMQQLLTGKKRLPGFSGEWQKMRLDQAAHIIVSNVDKKTSAAEQPVRLCNYMDVYHADQIKNDMPFMRATATSAQISKFGLKVGDVLITKDSETPDDIAVPSYVASTAGDLVCGYHLAIVRPKKALNGRFLKFYFDHPHTRYFFSSRANGATRFGLTIDAIETAPILLPSFAEQKHISEVIGTAENKIASLRPIVAVLRAEKAALMQQLLTGKRRVKIKGEAQAA